MRIYDPAVADAAPTAAAGAAPAQSLETAHEPAMRDVSQTRGLAAPAQVTQPAAPAAAPVVGGAPAQPAAAPAAGSLPPAAPPPPSPGASLEATIRLAADHGFQRARLTLRPAELGTVDVVLRASEGGVSASVLARTPEAARLLEAAGDELRRRLDLQGVQLQSLTVAVAGDAAAGAGQRGRDGAFPTTPGGGPAASASADAPVPDPTPTRRIELGGGVLLDVLA